MALDPATLNRLLGSIEANSLVLLCGAGLIGGTGFQCAGRGNDLPEVKLSGSGNYYSGVHEVSPSWLAWVASADATLAFAENGVCKRQGENAERGIIGGDPPLRGGGRLCRESPILFLPRADGAGP